MHISFQLVHSVKLLLSPAGAGRVQGYPAVHFGNSGLAIPESAPA